MSGATQPVAGLCVGALLIGAAFGAASHDIASWVEASYRCGEFPDNPRTRAPRREDALSAVAQVAVDADGRVAGVELRDPSGSRVFDHNIVDAVRTWQFMPRIKGGRPQGTSLDFRFDRTPGHPETVVTTIAVPGARNVQLQPQSCNVAP